MQTNLGQFFDDLIVQLTVKQFDQLCFFKKNKNKNKNNLIYQIYLSGTKGKLPE